ncbi:hypothetical protein ILYODFUR_037990 [Ilyodon furcidens]|uniref:Uncharacterized protein n=1 Tax=Ilyodon furcidens TaxID=33524 RepID=A0ABV0VKH4_9TELE
MLTVRRPSKGDLRTYLVIPDKPPAPLKQKKKGAHNKPHDTEPPTCYGPGVKSISQEAQHRKPRHNNVSRHRPTTKNRKANTTSGSQTKTAISQHGLQVQGMASIKEGAGARLRVHRDTSHLVLQLLLTVQKYACLNLSVLPCYGPVTSPE